jgi:hypothetical protein
MQMKRVRKIVVICLMLVGACLFWIGVRQRPRPDGPPLGASVSAETQSGSAPADWWVGQLSADKTVFLSFTLQPWSEETFRLRIRPRWVGLRVKEGWDIFDEGTKDGKRYWVRLTRVNDGWYSNADIEASKDWGEMLPHEKFVLKNGTPIAVSVVVFGVKE